MRTLGSGNSNFPKTPTLLQKLKKGEPVPDASLVRLIFKPGKLPIFSLVTEADYRVNVREEDALFRDLITLLEDVWHLDMALFVIVTNREKALWELAVDDDAMTCWEQRDWGLTMSSHAKRPKKRAPKNQRADSTAQVD
jgi:hypothetical protein